MKWSDLLIWSALALVVAVLLSALPAASERDESNRLAAKYQAKVEVQLPDGTRVDLLSDTHAWEVDWAYNYCQGIGQTLYYSLKTGKKPGLILLTEDPGTDWRLLVRAAELCGHHDIDFQVEIAKKEIAK